MLSSALILFVVVAIGSDNGFLFFLAWEAITVCVYLIASAGRTHEDLVGGYLTGGLAKLGGAALLAAFGLLYGHTHSFSLEVWRHAHLSAGTRDLLFALFLSLLRDEGRSPSVAGRTPRRIRVGPAARGRVTVGRVVCGVLRTLAIRVRRARPAADGMRRRAADHRRRSPRSRGSHTR